MNLDLEGRVALVTGSSNGIGAAIVRTLAAEGAQVIVHGRSAERAGRVAAGIVGNGGQAVVVTSDLSHDAGAESLVDQAVDAAGRIDILVNNAGVYANSTWEDATGDDWLATYNTNVVSVVRLIRCVMPAMRKAGWGRLIQLASGEASRPFANMPDYAATKAALVNLTVSVAHALAGSGVTANTVSPGIIVTDEVEKFYRDVAAREGWGEAWPEIEAAVLTHVLPNDVGRLGTADDVASVVAFLASPLSGFIDGANIRVDGASVPTIN